MRGGHTPSVTDRQLATQQSQTNEQFEALHGEFNALPEAIAKAVAEQEVVHQEVETIWKAIVKLQVASLTSKTTSESKTPWRGRCLKADAAVADLQKDNKKILQEIAVDQSQMLDAQDLATLDKKETTATSTSVGLMSFPTLSGSGRGEWADNCGLSAVGGRNEWTEHITSITPSWNGAWHLGTLRWSCHRTSRLHSFPSPWAGSGRGHVLSPGPHQGASSTSVGPPPRAGEAMETEETGQVPPMFMVTTGAPSTTTDQTRQRLALHLSKSVVNTLADRGATLGLGMKLLVNLEELGFLMSHSGAEFGLGRSSDLCACSTSLTVTCLGSSEHTSSDGGMKKDGPDVWS